MHGKENSVTMKRANKAIVLSMILVLTALPWKLEYVSVYVYTVLVYHIFMHIYTINENNIFVCACMQSTLLPVRILSPFFSSR